MLGLAKVMPRDLIMRGCIIIKIQSDRSISGYNYKSIGLSVRRSLDLTVELELVNGGRTRADS